MQFSFFLQLVKLALLILILLESPVADTPIILGSFSELSNIPLLIKILGSFEMKDLFFKLITALEK